MSGSRATRITAGYGTGSNERGENLEAPQDASDVLGMETEIGGKGGSAPRRSPMGGMDIGRNADPGKGIDLRKRPDIDLSKSSAAKPGIGIDISKSEAGNLGIGIEIPIPVPAPVSARGKIAIDPATGKIRGGGLGLGLGKGPIGTSLDIGVDTPPGSDKLGCFKYVTVSVSIFSHTFGKNECEPKPPPLLPSPPANPGDGSFPVGGLPQFDSRCTYSLSILCLGPGIEFTGCIEYSSGQSSQGWVFESERPAPGIYGKFGARKKHPTRDFYEYEIDIVPPIVGYVEIRRLGYSNPVVKGDLIKGAGPWYKDDAPKIGTNVTCPGTAYYSSSWTSAHGLSAKEAAFYGANFMSWWPMKGWDNYSIKIDQKCPGNGNYEPLLPSSPPNPSPPNSSSPPIPNPQPTKKTMDDACCKRVEALQLETLRMLGRQVVGGKLAPVGTEKGFLGEETERIKTPIKDVTKPEKVKIRFNTLYEMLLYELRQANNLDTALDPQSYKPPEGYLQNPEYSRDTEASLTNNGQPEKDKSGNKREFKINVDEEVKFSGFIQQQCYIFEAIKRLEYLFPFGELSDALIAKNLLIPGNKGDIKIHNMIQAYELQMQYLNAILGNPREEVVIKDANPAIKGDQTMTFKALSMSDLMRESIKFQIDTAGDLDALVNMSLRDFRTNLADRITNIQTAEMVTALFEDSGMIENQDYIKVNLEGDPYAGQWVQGKGFEPNPELDKNTEEATEKVLEATLKNFSIKIKVSRRDKREKTDMRDLLRGLADFVQRLLSVPASGDAVNKLIQDAKFKVQTDMALIRENVKQAATAGRNRTRKRKK